MTTAVCVQLCEDAIGLICHNRLTGEFALLLDKLIRQPYRTLIKELKQGRRA
jgi:hypothetical protein